MNADSLCEGGCSERKWLIGMEDGFDDSFCCVFYSEDSLFSVNDFMRPWLTHLRLFLIRMDFEF